jgi:hypothetical protein
MFQIYAVSAAPICEEGQKLRKDENGLKICCYTGRCNTSKIKGSGLGLWCLMPLKVI